MTHWAPVSYAAPQVYTGYLAKIGEGLDMPGEPAATFLPERSRET